MNLTDKRMVTTLDLRPDIEENNTGEEGPAFIVIKEKIRIRGTEGGTSEGRCDKCAVHLTYTTDQDIRKLHIRQNKQSNNSNRTQYSGDKSKLQWHLIDSVFTKSINENQTTKHTTKENGDTPTELTE